MEHADGLKRALNPGDQVIMSTGATATVRASYSKGFAGNVAVMLDGTEEIERAGALTLPDEPPIELGPELGDPTIAQQVEMGETRAPSRRMED